MVNAVISISIFTPWRVIENWEMGDVDLKSENIKLVVMHSGKAPSKFTS